MATEFGDSVSNKRGRDNASCSVFHKKWRHDVSGSYSHKGLTYDVFLSFRGEDTRHLFHCLDEKGVNAFIDNSLLRGEDISSQLIDTIRSSRISVMVLSRNYANSSWCLEELSEIMECRNKSIGQMVLPVFYDVDPSDVRKQTSCYGEAFAKHEAVKDKETVARWRAALTEVASLFGWDLTNYASGEEFFELAKAVVSYCEGLPLALEVLGSYLLELSVEDWKSALHQLGRNPHSDIQMKLEISYHALGSEDDKKLFLDIACFFVGWDKNLVVKVLEACDLCVGLGLDVLSRRSLVKITKKNKLEMHDMIRDMGREIVRRESPQNPGKRSRLFSLNDILATLRNHSGTEQVEGLVSNYYLELAEKLDAKAFERMRLLRLLELNNLHVDGDFGLISKELRWLCWHGFPLDFLPDELYMENLVVLDMQYSKLRSTWKTNSKEMPRLRVLNLSYSHFLTKTPDFSGLSKLEELIMEDCKELKEIDRSIGCLKGLLLMNLKDCEKLKSIPDSICKVRTLQILDIRGCSNLMRLPDDFGNLESLTELLADGAPIMQSPLSFANLKNLSKLSLWGYSRQRSSSISALVWSWISRREAPKENNCLIASVCGLRSLTELRLINCNILDDANLDGIGSLQNLIQFEISGSHIRCLPGSISSLSNLQIFTVNYCPKLESLPDLPQKIIAVRAIGCQSLERISLPNSPVETAYFPFHLRKSWKSEGIEVVLDVEPHPHLITRAIGIHLEVEKCPSCSGIYIDDVEAGPSHGNSHDKYPHETETKPTTEITAVEQWLLRYCPV
ncbi:hypothetical protein CRG98_024828 [Punica granatum]|uniref:TIR domain-containing protein n=1 Tax=Punica granatum TaxID=22663 RepID=A0A2I0JGP2_PUNGR|nr:hypothetical protein CRG98_024828 [Punica granatum]